ncbi:MAG: glycoside hydrolase family 44 protein, partial [Anaerolineales bacterium]|nr:glycoside hydrolase family 44 protein [Anaerolineales bacterium]
MKSYRWTVFISLVLFLLGIGSVAEANTMDEQRKFVPSATGREQASLVVTFTVDVTAERHPISPYIYGTNRLTADQGLYPAARLGGNRWTGYNWENNASNAGSDWHHSSDDFLCWILSCSDWNQPAAALKTFVDYVAERKGQYALLTLPMAGYVAADKNGTVSTDQTAPSNRWKTLVYRKNSAFSYPPDLNDQAVYVDELVAHLVQTYGNAATAAVRRGYSLDNEPDLWANTHPRLHPQKTTVAELIEKSASLASAVKAIDPQAEIFAPVHYGFWGMKTLQDAPDWAQHGQTYDWFVDYYLAQMRLRSQQAGRRLLDVFDFHWYPEAQGCGTRIVWNGVGGECLQQARMQAPRALWDENFQEDSWIGTWFGDYLPILPRLHSSIQTYYPGTKLAMTEFSYGAEDHISGGIAVADVLGILGKYGVYFASFYPLEGESDYVVAAYRLYRNFDGAGAAFGNISVKAETSDVASLS